jgi:hypothetical protein
MKKIRIIFYGTLLFLGFITFISFLNSYYQKSSKNDFIIRDKVSTDYLNIFNKKNLNRLRLKSIISLKLRNDIVNYAIDDKFDMQLTRLNVVSGFSLKDDIVLNSKDGLDGEFPNSIVPMNDENLILKYAANTSSRYKKININLRGDLLRVIIKNGCIIQYKLDLERLNLKCDFNNMFEIFTDYDVKIFDFKRPVSTIVAFIKNKNDIFFLAISSKDDDNIIPDNILSELLEPNLVNCK